MSLLPSLPVSDVIPSLRAALDGGSNAVLVAPPGAGKTTLVPLALLDEAWTAKGMMIIVEPRRIAARAAAGRMASLLGESIGQTVGFAVRLDTRSGPNTRILVVTDGVFTRMALDDPELKGISAVIFDEFHERSLDCDLGLALALDIQDGFRPDLKLIVMSATLDPAPVTSLMGNAPLIESYGKSFPVEIHYRPRKPGERIESAVASAVLESLSNHQGSILAFLPGQAEIRRCHELLDGRVPAKVDIMMLHGGQEGAIQDQAIAPALPGRRKVVLSTSIAETSITIDGVTTIIDSGMSRLPRHDPQTGLTYLETVRVSQASAAQRAGRAGRTGPGRAIRLWHEGQNASLPLSNPPAILEADLTSLLLDCAAFGVMDPRSLRFLDPPPEATLLEARRQLEEFGAMDRDGMLTPMGRSMRKLPLPVRVAFMLVQAAAMGAADLAAELAILLTERGLGGNHTDLERRLAGFRDDRTVRAGRARKLARRLARLATDGPSPNQVSAGRLLAEAFPERIAQGRGKTGHFRLANGRGAFVDEADPIAAASWLVVADVQGRVQQTRITAAAAITIDEIFDAANNRIESVREVAFDQQSATVRVRETKKLGALELSKSFPPALKGDQADEAILETIRKQGPAILPWDAQPSSQRQRLAWLNRQFGAPWPDMSDEALVENLDLWLRPCLQGNPRIDSISGRCLDRGLLTLVPYGLQHKLEKFAPSHFQAPTGNKVPIRYDGDQPVLAIRVQEIFGLDQHPMIADGAVPLVLELLSPARRPMQSTRDLPGFWRGSWREVRAQMRGRYPKHPWPECPELAQPTDRVKGRGH